MPGAHPRLLALPILPAYLLYRYSRRNKCLPRLKGTSKRLQPLRLITTHILGTLTPYPWIQRAPDNCRDVYLYLQRPFAPHHPQGVRYRRSVHWSCGHVLVTIESLWYREARGEHIF
jgi:hypothetical protein